MASNKIIVNHYLNKKAKPKIYLNKNYYPLYIQISVNGKRIQIKSRLNEHLKIYRSDIERITNNNKDLIRLYSHGYFSESQMKLTKEEKHFPLFYLLEDEINVITKIILFKEPDINKDFTLQNFTKEYNKFTYEITNIIDSSILELYQEELKKIFRDSIDQEEKKEIFKISNYFIHYLNWNNSFHNFYESTYEILPSELKLIEHLLNDELRTTIRSFMAYHTKVNILKRFFEKRDLGKISTLSYIDWETDIKKFILKEFKKIFGEPKGIQYVESLDNILIKNIRKE